MADRKVFYMFSGQGSQKVGMGKDLFDSDTLSAGLFERAKNVLGQDFISVLFNGPEDELKKTEITQPAVFLVSYAFAKAFDSGLKKRGKKLSPEKICGHSLGEYTACCYAGLTDFDSGLKLIKKRGELIRDACLKNPGTMAAVMGVPDSILIGICKELTEKGDYTAAVNFNSPAQTVISGTVSGIEKAKSAIKEAVPASKVIPLKVSGAFHSVLVKEAEEGMRAELAGYSFNSLSGGLVFKSGYDLSETADAEKIKGLLSLQISNPVNWYKIIRDMENEGFDTAIEFGPGEVLSGLVKKTSKKINAFSVNSVEKLNKTLEAV